MPDARIPRDAAGEHVARRKSARRRLILVDLLADAGMLAFAAAAAVIGGREAGIPAEPPGWIVAFCLLTLLLLGDRRRRRHALGASVLDEAASIIFVTATAAMTIIALRVVVESEPDAARQTVRLWGFAAVYLCAGHVGLSLSKRRANQRGEGLATAVIVGSGEVARRVARRLLDRPHLGVRPLGYVDDDPPDQAGSPLPVLGGTADLERVLVDRDVSYAVIAFTTAPDRTMLAVTRACARLDVAVLMVPRLFEGVNNRISVEHLGGLPLLAARPIDPRGAAFFAKHALDRVAGSLLLLLALPPIAVGAIAMRLSSPGRVLFRQPRVGRDGHEFEMLKLRTMRGSPGEYAEADAAWAARSLARRVHPADEPPPPEDRLTRVGHLLRRYSIDELPQLWNVVKGDMSLVGPRPERTQYVRMFTDAVYRYDDRHRVKSGVTGWAQVHGLRGPTSLEDRVEWDNYYIDNWSLGLDLRILLLTLRVFYRGGGA